MSIGAGRGAADSAGVRRERDAGARPRPRWARSWRGGPRRRSWHDSSRSRSRSASYSTSTGASQSSASRWPSGVTALFGFAPALRASSVTPVTALKGGEAVRSRRVIKSLLVVQMTFCAFVLFAAGLFRATFDRLSSQSFGLSYDHVLAVAAAHDDGAPARSAGGRSPRPQGTCLVSNPPRSPAGRCCRRTAGTSTITGGDQGAEPHDEQFLGVSSGFFATLRIQMLEGRDFRTSTWRRLSARRSNRSPASASSTKRSRAATSEGAVRSATGVGAPPKDTDAPLNIVGVVADTAYRHVASR